MAFKNPFAIKDGKIISTGIEAPQGLTMFPLYERFETKEYGIVFKIHTVYSYRDVNHIIPKYFWEAVKRVPLPSVDSGKRLADFYDKPIKVNGHPCDARLLEYNTIKRTYHVIFVVFNLPPDNDLKITLGAFARKSFNELIKPLYKVPFERYLIKNKLNYSGFKFTLPTAGTSKD